MLCFLVPLLLTATSHFSLGLNRLLGGATLITDLEFAGSTYVLMALLLLDWPLES
jgi:hypothetical protein